MDIMSFYPGAVVVLDGSNKPGLEIELQEEFPFLYLTDKEGAYIKSY
jgi:hypothetical protein